jgi:MFS family permease
MMTMTVLNEDISVAGSKLYAKISWRLIPFLLGLYLICYIDRVNIGFAKLQFLGDLGLNDAHFGFATGLFFVTYSLFDIPSNLVLARIVVRKTLLRIMVAWGVLTAAQMFIRTAGELYVVRLLFGAAEAGFIPGILLYLTYWFPDQYRGRVTSLFLMAIPLSGVIGGPISGMIMQHLNDVGGLRGWQWLFLLEGIPAVILGFVAYFYLQDGPAQARWLTEQERATIEHDLESDRQKSSRGFTHGFAEVFKDPMMYALMLMSFTVNCGINTVSFWTPSLLKAAGLGDIGLIGWATGVISVVSAAAMVLIGTHSDRHIERRWHYTISGVLGAFSLFALPLAAGNVPLTALILTLAAIGSFCVACIYWTVPTSYLRGKGKAGGIAAVSMVGAIGSGVSPSIIGYLKVETGSLFVGLAVVGVMMLAGAILGLFAIPSNAAPAPVIPALKPTFP